jgi:hypothetical protein
MSVIFGPNKRFEVDTSSEFSDESEQMTGFREVILKYKNKILGVCQKRKLKAKKVL